VKNVRRIRGFSLVSAQHRVQYIQLAEPFSIEYKTDVARVEAQYTVTHRRGYTGSVVASHSLTYGVYFTGAVSASDRYTVIGAVSYVPGALVDATGNTFILGLSPLAPLGDALVDAIGRAFVFDWSRLAPLEGVLVDAAGRPFTLDVSALG
jgi:hypothetical protein